MRQGSVAIAATAALIATATLAQAPSPTDLEKSSETFWSMRAIGIALLSWHADLFGERDFVGQDEVDFDHLFPISYDHLAELLVPTYIDELPRNDAWGGPFEFRLAANLDEEEVNLFAIRSAGADGNFQGDTYASGPFGPDDPAQDIVWFDGYFARWPRLAYKLPRSVVGEYLDRLDFAPCREAERIARQGPCLDAASCGAYRSWQQLFGSPGLDLLDPQYSNARASLRGGARRTPSRDRPFVCPAD